MAGLCSQMNPVDQENDNFKRPADKYSHAGRRKTERK